MLLNAQKIEKYFGERLIFSFDSFKIYAGDKIGIVGDNGAGKSTLMKVLAGIVECDSGIVNTKAVIAYVDQLSQYADTPDNLQASIFGVTQNAHSGGEIMRQKLACAFSTNFDILMLDEPTSNLDTEAIQSLNAVLCAVQTLVLISHDRQLLDNHCNKIVEVKDGKLSFFSGGWTEYHQASTQARQRQEFLYQEFRKEKKRLEKAVKEREQKASKMKKTPSRMGNSEARLHKREATAKQAKIMNAGSNILTRLEQMVEVERPSEIKHIKPDFWLTDPPKNKIVLSAENLNFAYDHQIFCNASFEIENGQRVAVVGSNGSGKSTLLKLICTQPDLVKKVPKAKIGYLSQDFSHLNQNATILQNVLDSAVQSSTVCRNVLASMGFCGDEVFKNVGVLSGGELLKISLCQLIVSDCNILVLDEPTNYLDINSLLQVQNALSNYQGTLVFVSHDQAFVEALATKVLKISDGKIVCLPALHN